MTNDAELTLSNGQTCHSELSVGGLYRHVSQAWDFYPSKTELEELTPEIVKATLQLTNGGSYRKSIMGEYQLRGDRIKAIRLQDSTAAKVTT